MPLGASRISFLAKTQVTVEAEVIRKKVDIKSTGATTSTGDSKFGGTSALMVNSGDQVLFSDDFSWSQIGTGDFTIEMWINANSFLEGSVILLDPRGGGDTTPNWLVGLDDVSGYKPGMYVGGWVVSDTALSTGTWYHLAWVRSSGTLKCYVDGTEKASVSFTGDLDQSGFGLGSRYNLNQYTLDGYMDEVRISDTARYTSGFTPDTTPFTNDNNTLLLLHMDGTDGNEFFEDDNGTRTKVGVRAEGTGQIDTAQYKFGGASFVADGSGDDNLAIDENVFDWTKISDHADGGDYTLECWIRSTNVGTTNAIFGTRTSTASHNWDLEIRTNNGNGTLRWFNGNSELYYSAGGVVSANTWHHIAAVIEGADLTVYVDGTAVITQTRTDSNNTGGSDFFIGKGGYPTLNKFYGNIDEFRLSDTARYTTSFTAPTEPFVNDANTLLLLHMDGKDASTDFVDDNGKGRAQVGVSANGNAQIDIAQSKFGGASAVFDGTGDYLTVSNDTDAFDFGTADWTIEFWFRADTLPTFNDAWLFDPRITSGGAHTTIGMSNSKLNYFAGGIYRIESSTLSTNTWYHAAVVSNSQTITMYLDGVSQGTYSSSYTYTANNTIYIGANSSGNDEFDGYIDEFRVSDTCRYTTGFTPDTAPFQNDENTLLLLHMDGTDGSTTFIDDNGTY